MLSVAENVFLGNEQLKGKGVIDWTKTRQKATEMLQQGYDKDQIIASSVAAGIAEAFFEKFSLEVFLGAKGGLDVANLLWNIAKQAGAEASEEYFTELANQISDDLILGNESEAARKITTYIEQGLSREDAEIKLQKERRGERLHSLVGGALSGFMMGGVASVGNQREYKGAAIERGSVEDGNAVEAAAKSASKLSRLGTEYAKMKIGNKVKSAFGGSGELTNACLILLTSQSLSPEWIVISQRLTAQRKLSRSTKRRLLKLIVSIRPAQIWLNRIIRTARSLLTRQWISTRETKTTLRK